MAKQAGYDRHRHAVHHRLARQRMPNVVQPAILDARLAADAVSEPEVPGARPRGVERRRKHEIAAALGLSFENAPRRRVKRDPSRPRLAVAEYQRVAVDL